jgi:hypothetical protein
MARFSQVKVKLKKAVSIPAVFLWYMTMAFGLLEGAGCKNTSGEVTALPQVENGGLYVVAVGGRVDAILTLTVRGTDE